MSGKRKWSAARAADRLEAAHGASLCLGDARDCLAIDAEHLARAYLAGIEAAGGPEKTGEFLRAETERLERASRRGKDRT